ncbi:uncharacterized protein LOC120425751 [Culex pipiens pallens]|uniref:uncharacterized protein LOC120425751 n=1 Tax=Culex pipiens pallens TaxID=42434 RepID=UPI0019546B6D|nr:uncharacterized protein LOC120425751 [Culex pipiens pallens]
MSETPQTTDNELDLTTTPCGSCNQVSVENEKMIGCDGCRRWFHYRCVGVTDAAKKTKNWYCVDEVCQKVKKSRKKEKPDPLTLEQKRKAQEEEQKRQEQALEEEMMLLEERRLFQKALAEKRSLLEEKLREKEEEDRKARQAEALKRKKDFVQRFKSEQSSFEKEMTELEKELEDLKAADATIIKKDKSGTSGKPSNLEKEPESGAEADSELSSDEILKDANAESTRRDLKHGKKVSRLGQGSIQIGPTKAQLAARNGISKKLPDFAGNPEEWPLFYGAYCASNEACGYTDVENLVRLQDSLRAPALDWVRGKLILPQSVPLAIAKLQQMCGRPEQLLQSYLDKVRKLEPPKADKLASFIPFGNAVEQLCEHLEAVKLKQHLANPLLIQDLVDKLPDGEKRQWIRFKRHAKEVTLRTFTDFLSEIVADACEANVSMDSKHTNKASSSGQGGKQFHREKGAMYHHSEEENASTKTNDDRRKFKPCKICHGTDHRLRNCPEFKKLQYADRVKVVNHWKLCSVCLNDHDGECTFRTRCNVGLCKERHNPLMHPIDRVEGLSAHIRTKAAMMFRMLPVQLHYGGRATTVLAFLDEGSSITLVERQLADNLGIVGVEEKLTINWTASIRREEKNSRRMNLWASASDGGNKLLLQTVRTVEKLMLPYQKLDFKTLAKKYQHMKGLEVASYDGQPGLLIGLNNVHAFAPIEAKVGAMNEPIAVRGRLGWTVYGPRQLNAPSSEGFLGVHHEITNEEIHALLKSHYAVEESVVATVLETTDEKRAREIMEQTTRRVGDRFETGLLWKSEDPRFPNSLPMAMGRMKNLERKLEKNPDLRENVCRQIEEYQLKGYAHVATPEELANTDPEKTWYLPLNVVTNPRKPGKYRLVWDAAATVQGVSLNSQLLTGPDLLVPLIQVIVGFRERPVAFGGDIREMYHQLRIRRGDTQAQRFLFRKNFKQPAIHFVMDVATFGAACSPSSAQFVKNKNAEEHALQYPEAAAAIINRHYVDDYFDSVDTIEEAVKRAGEVKMIHKNGGFEIRNWVANLPEVLRRLGEEKPASHVHFSRDKQTSNERVLGIIWDPDMDEFAFSVQHRPELMAYLYEDKRPTKQIALSWVMGFFDPLGLLSPFTIHGKILIQRLWRQGCDWKDEIDDESWRLWKRWVGLLPQVEKLRIPRGYFGSTLSTEIDSLEIHIFTDASEHAYGCAAFFRAVVGGTVKCSLIMSRARVAPLKRQSIPRLELDAAKLGARLKHTVLGMHSLQVGRCVMWTDSRTVCSWLRADQYKYKQYVAFRVGEILELTSVMEWHWVSTKYNIADVLTKWGRTGPPLASDSEWISAPSFLYQPPGGSLISELPFWETDEDARSVVLFHNLINVCAVSKWSSLVRVTANVVRFIENCRRKRMGLPIITTRVTYNYRELIKRKTPTILLPLQQEEFQKAEAILWKQTQFECFPDEMSTLTANLNLKPGRSPAKIEKSSVLFKLGPSLDENGVLRMTGRLANMEGIPYDQKFPIILARQHEITKRLIQDYHERFGHANRETVCNELRQKFWIPNLRAAISEVTSECVWCKVHHCLPQVPMMAPLPAPRVRAGLRPFSSVDVDYLGPVEVTVGRRKEKRWVAVFTCMTVRAVHLEVVNSLTTQSCLMAVRRFICKRGAPDEILSDNATCFKGASNEMKKAAQRITTDCAEKIISSTTAWRFIPPGTPHMGGAWERMVRSVKEAMMVLNDGMKLTDEILATTLAEAEDMINTRPLTYVPQESADLEALTPNHFLRGSVKLADLAVDKDVNPAQALRNIYKRTQHLANQMWGRWSKEYLATINRRTKWFDERRPLKAGDLVFVVDGRDRKQWTRGIVEEVIPGIDGRIREAKVRTSGGVHRRAVVNLAVMEIQEGNSGSSDEMPEVTGGGVNATGHTAVGQRTTRPIPFAADDELTLTTNGIKRK